MKLTDEQFMEFVNRGHAIIDRINKMMDENEKSSKE